MSMKYLPSPEIIRLKISDNEIILESHLYPVVDLLDLATNKMEELLSKIKNSNNKTSVGVG